jgi:CubicO group peptidase (beta-lactamase class C family)
MEEEDKYNVDMINEFLISCYDRSASFVALLRQNAPTNYMLICARQYDLSRVSLSHIFSMTKSFVGLCYVHLLLTTTDMPHDVIIGDVEMFNEFVSREGMHNVRFVDLLNHTSGLVSGVDPGKFNAKDAMMLLANPTTEQMLDRAVHRFEKTPVRDDATRSELVKSFSYNNYGSYLFGMLLETFMRCEQVLEGKEPTWFVRDYARDELHLFEGLVENRDYIWPVHRGVGVTIFSAAFAGIKTSGDALVVVACNILDKHRMLLDFIQGDRPVVVNGRIVRNMNRVPATVSHVCATVTGACDEDVEVELPVDYSYGFWVPVIQGRRVLSMIGMLGQFMAWDLDNNLVAVRTHTLDIQDMVPKNQHRDFVFDAMDLLWKHFKL